MVGAWWGQCHIVHEDNKGHPGPSGCKYDYALSRVIDYCVSGGSPNDHKAICSTTEEDCVASSEDIANARLIAAAPDLLEACELMIAQVPILADVFKFSLPSCVGKALEAVNKVKVAP